jgi:hypothetical protein
LPEKILLKNNPLCNKYCKETTLDCNFRYHIVQKCLIPHQVRFRLLCNKLLALLCAQFWRGSLIAINRYVPFLTKKSYHYMPLARWSKFFFPRAKNKFPVGPQVQAAPPSTIFEYKLSISVIFKKMYSEITNLHSLCWNKNLLKCA